MFMQGGPFKYPLPRALEESEIAGIVEAYAKGAKNARAAGFDGVEVRGAGCPCSLANNVWQLFAAVCLAAADDR